MSEVTGKRKQYNSVHVSLCGFTVGGEHPYMYRLVQYMLKCVHIVAVSIG